MQRMLILVMALVVASCGSEPGTCIYTTANKTHSCIQYTSGNKTDFLHACKQVLALNRSKYPDMTMIVGKSCPVSATVTCRDFLDQTADLNLYNLSSGEIEIQRRVCERTKGSFVEH